MDIRHASPLRCGPCGAGAPNANLATEKPRLQSGLPTASLVKRSGLLAFQFSHFLLDPFDHAPRLPQFPVAAPDGTIIRQISTCAGAIVPAASSPAICFSLSASFRAMIRTELTRVTCLVLFPSSADGGRGVNLALFFPCFSKPWGWHGERRSQSKPNL